MVICAKGDVLIPSKPIREFQIEIHDANQIEMCISNYGKIGQAANGGPGCWWPKGSGYNYMFGAGPWFGTIDQIFHDTLVTMGYGPHGHESEYVPGLKDMSYNNPAAIIYMHPQNWPPPITEFPMAPQELISYNDSWCVFNDCDINAHVPGDTRPIGLEVYQTIYQWNLVTTKDLVFVKYEIKNVSNKKLTDCYFGVCTDNDIGSEVAGNDIISGIVGQWYIVEGESLWVDNLGYQWQEQVEPGWEEFPGTIGFDYLQSPWDLVPGNDKDSDGIPDEYERDSSFYINLPDSMWDVDLDGTPDWRDPSEIPQLGMTAFKRFSRSNEPNRDGERYLTLAGYDFRTGEYQPFDTATSNPDDQRFLQCSGPFDLEVDSTAIVLISIMLANWFENYQNPDTAIIQIDEISQFIYDMNWSLPKPPSPPRLTCVPGDAQVTLIWGNGPEVEPDPYYEVVSDPANPNLYDPYYREYDFEGYRVWRSITGQAGDWELLSVCDKFNTIRFTRVSEENEDDTLRAEDTGLFHSYLDNGVRNGFLYYYAVTSFDYNQVKSDSLDSLGNPLPMDIVFESGAVGYSAAPRRDPANYLPGSTYVELISGNPLLVGNIETAISYPLEMTSDGFMIEFDDIGWEIIYVVDTLDTIPPVDIDTVVAARYTAYLKDNSDNLLDSVGLAFLPQTNDVPYMFQTFNGVNVTAHFIIDSLPVDDTLFDWIEVVTGSYPDTLLRPKLPWSYSTFWPYRGNDYKVTWVATSGGSANSVVVTDAIVGDIIPYSAYSPDALHGTDTLASGWCFLSQRRIPSDTLMVLGSPIFRTWYMYINGGLFTLAGGGPVMDTLRPGVGDEWYVHATDDYVPAPCNAQIRVYSMPASYDMVTPLEALNVKVVPNPYLIHNEWQQSFSNRRLKFINLPSECTIRVFNLNGELVKTIKHHHTLSVESGEEEIVGSAGGDEWWDLLSENRQLVASGVYIYHIESDVGEQVGKLVIIR